MTLIVLLSIGIFYMFGQIVYLHHTITSCKWLWINAMLWIEEERHPCLVFLCVCVCACPCPHSLVCYGPSSFWIALGMAPTCFVNTGPSTHTASDPESRGGLETPLRGALQGEDLRREVDRRVKRPCRGREQIYIFNLFSLNWCISDQSK